MTLQLIVAFRCSVNYAMKQASAFTWLLQYLPRFHCVWSQL